jgi:hypothetical protein
VIELALTSVALVLVIIVGIACLDCFFYMRLVTARAQRINAIREERRKREGVR